MKLIGDGLQVGGTEDLHLELWNSFIAKSSAPGISSANEGEGRDPSTGIPAHKKSISCWNVPDPRLIFQAAVRGSAPGLELDIANAFTRLVDAPVTTR
jgi:hypothetical protein